MTVQPSFLYVIFWFLLSINIQGQYVGALIKSSLEKSNRRFACPSESVSFTCNISGTSLAWEIQEGNARPSYDGGIFRQSDPVGHCRFEQNPINSCQGEFNSFSVLEYNMSFCISTMTIRPTSLNVSSDCDPLKVICKAVGESNPKNKIYKIASRPIAPRNSTTCTYDKSSKCLNVTVNVTDIMVNNEETDISYVSIAVSSGTDLEFLRSYSISPMAIDVTKINDTFTHLVNLPESSIHITVGDKCGQENIPEMIRCTAVSSLEQMCNDCPILAASMPVGVIALIVIAIESTI